MSVETGGGGGMGLVQVGGGREGIRWGTRCVYACVLRSVVVGGERGRRWGRSNRSLGPLAKTPGGEEGSSLGSHMKRHGKRSHAYDPAPSVCQTLKTLPGNIWIHPVSNKQRSTRRTSGLAAANNAPFHQRGLRAVARLESWIFGKGRR